VENEKWFLNLGESEFKQLCLQWIKHHTGTDIPKLASYDEWLNYFKTLSPLQIKALGDVGQGFLSTEAYAALTRWADILKSPHRIDKIYQAGLTKPKTEQKSIIELAKSNDKLGLLYAIRDQIAEKLEKGAGARDTANLAREMGEILDQISEAEKRQGPKKNTLLAELMGEMPVQTGEVSPKRKRNNGARDRNYASKLTIEDVENA
jgi:hypothetical protein